MILETACGARCFLARPAERAAFLAHRHDAARWGHTACMSWALERTLRGRFGVSTTGTPFPSVQKAMPTPSAALPHRMRGSMTAPYYTNAVSLPTFRGFPAGAEGFGSDRHDNYGAFGADVEARATAPSGADLGNCPRPQAISDAYHSFGSGSGGRCRARTCDLLCVKQTL